MTIKELRAQTGLSQRQFAVKFDISVRTLQQWEQNISSPPAYTFELIKRLLAYETGVESMFSLEKYRLLPRTTFKICIPDPFQNCSRIYPIQQRKVRLLIDDILSNSDPRRIIVFGSSVTERCHIGSDVDIYAELPYDERPIKGAYDFEYDFWSNFTADERLTSEILKKGVVVYG